MRAFLKRTDTLSTIAEKRSKNHFDTLAFFKTLAFRHARVRFQNAVLLDLSSLQQRKMSGRSTSDNSQKEQEGTLLASEASNHLETGQEIPRANCIRHGPLQRGTAGQADASKQLRFGNRSNGRPIFIQCRYWEELRSLYEVSRPQPSTG